ncbi:MAG: hypothetical protein HQM10_26175 [Candidatus Riflebacteria bacterium]|nr:hypothetical protein [Candidatus Riflebacteria bacterium]
MKQFEILKCKRRLFLVIALLLIVFASAAQNLHAEEKAATATDSLATSEAVFEPKDQTQKIIKINQTINTTASKSVNAETKGKTLESIVFNKTENSTATRKIINTDSKTENNTGKETETKSNKPSKLTAISNKIHEFFGKDDTDNFDDKSEFKLNISGTKTFEMKQAQVKGDIGHFSTENFDSIPGFRLDQSLHLEIDGNLNKNTKVNAVLDDKEDEDRRFTVFVEGRLWNLTLGDFPLALKDTEFVLHNKEIRGIMAAGTPHPKWETVFLFSQSKGVARREQFRGAGQQQEFRLLGRPVVQNSERIIIDGRTLSRGSDYFVDYEDGIVKLQAHLLPIEITSWIVIEYEVTDVKLAFKRNLYGGRVAYKPTPDKKIGLTYLRESDSTTPKTGENASATSSPMDHFILAADTSWRLNDTFSIGGEYSTSFFDPNTNLDTASSDQQIFGTAARFSLFGKSEKLAAEYIFRQIDKEFKLIGREGGITELGERGLVRDVQKHNGRFNYRIRDNLSVFGGVESSRTNLSADPAFSEISFLSGNTGLTWKYRPKSQFEFRLQRQTDEERWLTPLSDQDKDNGVLVWDHEFSKFIVQNKVEHTAYNDRVNLASDSRALQMQTIISSDFWKNFTWSAALSRLTLDDDYDPNELRSIINNYTLDMNYDPNRVFNARGIIQWRTETDNLIKTTQDDQIADSRIRYQPNDDFTSQLKYKVENTTKVVRDPSIDAAKYIRPPSLPLERKDQEEVVERFENPVQKKTANFSTSYRLGNKGETFFDWKRRDLKDRSNKDLLSFNDRKIYELRYFPVRQIKLSAEYEDGIAKNFVTPNQLCDSVKRIEAKNEFWEGYIFTGRWEDRDENDLLIRENDKRTESKVIEFNRVFSEFASLEMGVQRNVITFREPSKEWEQRAAMIITPSARNQRYKFFLLNKVIESDKPGNHFEGGLNFSQFIGADSMLDGEIKRVKSTAGITGSGYEATIANAKMVITF